MSQNIMSMIVVMSDKETLISTVIHFFSYFMLVSKLYDMSVFKSCNIFQICPVSQAFLYLRLFRAFFCGKLSSCFYFTFFLVCKMYKSVLKVTPTIGTILDFWTVLILEVYQQHIILQDEFQPLVTFLAAQWSFYWYS